MNIFPKDITDTTFLNNLPSTTGAKLVKYNDKSFVLKDGDGINEKRNHIREEYVANKIYNYFGIKVPQMKIYETPTNTSILSEYLYPNEKFKKSYSNDIRYGFVIDALLANWDVLGQDLDNIIIFANGKVDRNGYDGVFTSVYRIDNGGALRYRAQGQPKGNAFTPNIVNELNSMRCKSTMNAPHCDIFQSLDDTDIILQIKRYFVDAYWDFLDFVTKLDMSNDFKELVDILKSRIEYLISLYIKAGYNLFAADNVTNSTYYLELNGNFRIYDKKYPYNITSVLRINEWNKKIKKNIEMVKEHTFNNTLYSGIDSDLFTFYIKSNIWYSKNTILDSEISNCLQEGYLLLSGRNIVLLMKSLINEMSLNVDTEYTKRYYKFMLQFKDYYSIIFDSVDYMHTLNQSQRDELANYKSSSNFINNVSKNIGIADYIGISENNPDKQKFILTLEKIQVLDSILINAPKLKHDIIIWRGIKGNSNNINPNSNSITSVSLGPSIAKSFSGSCCLFRIVVKKDTPLLFLDDTNFTSNGEFECILPRSSIFELGAQNTEFKYYNTIVSFNKNNEDLLHKKLQDVIDLYEFEHANKKTKSSNVNIQYIKKTNKNVHQMTNYLSSKFTPH